METRGKHFLSARRLMVAKQLEARGIEDSRVLAAMECVAREEFVPPHLHEKAYADCALPIDAGQTISQPYTVAFMCAGAQIDPQDKVLEIGTGSGYGAAVLSLLAREVHTLERFPELAEQARERLQRLGYHNVTVHVVDGTLGLPEEAPFDVIVVTAGARQLPENYIEQLAENGRIVIPMGLSPHHQMMHRLTRVDGELRDEVLGEFAFVPLVGQHGWEQ